MEIELIAQQLRLYARAQDRWHELVEAVLSRNVDVHVVLDMIVGIATELVGARYGALGVLDENGEKVADLITNGLSDKERAALKHSHLPEGRGLLGRIMAVPDSFRVDDIRAHPDSAGFPPGHPEMHTLLGTAISTRGKIYGDLYVADKLDNQPFNEHDEYLINGLADAAGLAIDSARLFEQTRVDAELFQRLLLPYLPDLHPFEAATTYRPSRSPRRIGGDWYDALLAPGNACTAVIGDVMGHDLRAAATMAQTRNMLRALLYDRNSPPSTVLSHLDHVLQGVTNHPVTTACVAWIEPSREGYALRWSSAGHPPPLLITPEHEVRYLEAEPDLPLGVDTTFPRTDHVCLVPAGSTVVFFTDGLIEHSKRSLDVGQERLAEIIKENAGLPLKDLVETVTDQHPGDGSDDIAVIALRMPPYEHAVTPSAREPG